MSKKNLLLLSAILLAALLVSPAQTLAAPALAPSTQVSCPCSIWSTSSTPAELVVDDNNPIEVGVKFRSSMDGYVTGLRFYKGATNTGTHVGHLWTGAGTLLATVTFTGETASGWQQIMLEQSIAVISNTTYVASYHTDAGYYSRDSFGLQAAVNSPPLRALADGEDGGNGVYAYGPSGTFPDATFEASNYWVDIIFDTTPGPDTLPPTVSSVSPTAHAINISAETNLAVTFSEAISPTTVTASNIELRDSMNNLVPASVTYDVSMQTATLNPTSTLDYLTRYTATVKGGSTGIQDLAGNAMASDYSWTFTTVPSPPDQGPGGPILVVASAANPFGRYYAEILRTEGFNAFTTTDISLVTAPMLNNYDVVILGEMGLTAPQVTLFSNWVNAGGNLIAMRPDKQLAGLLGLTDASSTLSNAYLLVNTAAAPGAGIFSDTMQYHGTADYYNLNSATSIATLYSSATTPTTHPAVTLRSVGNGHAAAFTYDLARSIVYTRQGNPAWAGQDRFTNEADHVIISNDLFYPGWLDFSKDTVPQADEQQRLLANLILHINVNKKPLPRFWYFPRDLRAVVIMTSDDHLGPGTATRFNEYISYSTPGCSVADWECIRSSSFLYPWATTLTDTMAMYYTANGFEVGLHVDTNCENWTPSQLETLFTTQLDGYDPARTSFSEQFPSLPAPSSERNHCVTWSDWVTSAKVEFNHGIRLDTNYYDYPFTWMQGRAGLFTGSGMPMRFADTDGTMVDVYQATTQMTDQSGQTYPDAINALLDRALGPEGFYGAFTANMHADQPPDLGSDAIIASAQARGVPVVSGHQMLEWLDGRNASAFQSLNWDGHILTFTISVGHGANGLRAMIPTTSSAGALTGIRFNGAAIYYPTQVIKGVEYALVSAGAGQYEAMYGIDNTPPFIMNVSALPISGSSAIVTWDTNELADSRVDYGVSPAALNLNATNTLAVTTHIITLTALTPETTYYYRVTSVDPSGNSSTSPDAGSPLSFTTPLASLVDTTFDHFSAGMSMTNIYIGLTTDGQFMITPTVGAEFSGVSLPAGWTAEEYNGPGSGGSAVVSGGSVTLDGMRLRTDALYGPGRSIEFVATFRPGPYQDVGFGVDLMTGGWATFSTADTGESLWASTAQTGSPTPPNTNLGSSYLGAPHRYRIDWNATNVVFWIDGTRVATHTVTISTSMRPIAGEYDTGGQVLNVDWMHMSPYTNTASFTSRVLDGGNVSQWLNLDWAGSQPTSTSVHFETRSGSTATPDGSWSPWAAVNSPITSPDGRYIQYRATLSTTDLYVSPAVEAVSIGYRQTPTAVPASLHFYGTVRVGAKTPMGTIVSAWINGVKYAETTVTLNGVNTVYDLDVPGDDSDTTEIEGGRTGDTVYFRIGDKPAHQTAQWPWMEPLFGWQTVKLDLTGDQLHLIYLSVIIR